MGYDLDLLNFRETVYDLFTSIRVGLAFLNESFYPKSNKDMGEDVKELIGDISGRYALDVDLHSLFKDIYEISDVLLETYVDIYESNDSLFLIEELISKMKKIIKLTEEHKPRLKVVNRELPVNPNPIDIMKDMLKDTSLLCIGYDNELYLNVSSDDFIRKLVNIIINISKELDKNEFRYLDDFGYIRYSVTAIVNLLDCECMNSSTFVVSLCDLVDYTKYTKDNLTYDYSDIRPFIRSCFLDYKINGDISDVATLPGY